MSFDPTIAYTGPQADFASLTGSPFWGFGVASVIRRFTDAGWQLQLSERLPTPYGPAPLVNHFTNPSGRSILWIPSYGEVVGEDSLYHLNFEKVFWVPWHHLYTKVFPEIAMAVELDILTNAPIPPSSACRCTTSLYPAPPVFSQTLT